MPEEINILEKFRQDNGLTYEELAEKLEVSFPQAWRLCKHGLQRRKMIVKLSEVLKISESEVFEKLTVK